MGAGCVATFNAENVTTGGAAIDFYSIWGSAANNVFVGGLDNTNSIGVIFWNNTLPWSKASNLPSGAPPITGIWGDSASDVYAVGSVYGKVYNSTGAGLFTEVQSTGTFDEYLAVWGSGNFQNIWVVGGSVSTSPGAIVDRHMGAAWMKETTNIVGQVAATGVWGSGDMDVYAVINDGRVIHSTGSGIWGTPQQFSHTSKALAGIWGADATHIWAVGAAGTIIFTAGNGLSILSSIPQ